MSRSENSTMTSHPIAAVIDTIDSLPTLPSVVARVIEMTADPEHPPEDILKILSVDASLVSSILKMANSSFFGLGAKVSSLRQALMILGFTEVRNVVIAKFIFARFNDLKNNTFLDLGPFWTHSFLCAMAAKMIAADLRAADHELFVSGLIHDIGKLVMSMAFPGEYRRLTETAETSRTVYEEEKRLLGVTHDEAGMMLFQRWLFPDNLIAAVGFHHRPRESTKQPLFALVIHVADILAHVEKQGVHADTAFSPRTILSPEILDLSREQGIDWTENNLKRYYKQMVKTMNEEFEILGSLVS